VILDLEQFIRNGRPLWSELESILTRMETEPRWRPTLAEATRLHYLYERAAADLGRLATFASEPMTRRYLESLVARAYGEIHEARDTSMRFRPATQFLREFPRAFRRHLRWFAWSAVISLAGVLFGAMALVLDPDSRHATMAYGHDRQTPSERVHQEETGAPSGVGGSQARFAGFLMTHNLRVSLTTLALGMTGGLGTVISLFYNGVILGSVAADYINDGQSAFLAGWILPHGTIEIPAILIAGQAGLLLGAALIGRGSRDPLRLRLAAIRSDLLTLITGITGLLIWAGLVEGFFSQYHEPAVPYALKIAFGLLELVLLILFLIRCGRDNPRSPTNHPLTTDH
jgi:uncharacterized membrane protein SpoIIM required for sporulation